MRKEPHHTQQQKKKENKKKPDREEKIKVIFNIFVNKMKHMG